MPNFTGSDRYRFKTFTALLFLFTFSMLGCGGGGGSSNSNNQPTPTPANPTINLAKSDFTVTSEDPTTVELSSTINASTGSIAKIEWTQISGEAVVLESATTAIASFTTTNLTTNQVLSFRVSAEDSNGRKAQSTVDVTVEFDVVSFELNPIVHNDQNLPLSTMQVGSLIGNYEFQENEQLTLFDESTSLTLIGDSSGNGAVFIEADVATGDYSFTLNKESVFYQFTVSIIKNENTDTDGAYLSNFIGDFKARLSVLEATLDSATYSTIEAQLEEFELEVNALSEDEQVELARLMNSNLLALNALLEQRNSLANSVNVSLYSRSLRLGKLDDFSEECGNSLAALVTQETITATTVLISTGLGVYATATLNPLAAIASLGVGLMTLGSIDTNIYAAAIRNCLGPIINTIVEPKSEEKIDFTHPSKPFITTKAKHKYEISVKSNNTQGTTVDIEDEATEEFVYLVEVEPDEAVAKAIDSVIAVISNINGAEPIVNKLNEFKSVREVDISADIDIEPFDDGTIACEGQIANLHCFFISPDNPTEPWALEDTSVNLSVSHPKISTALPLTVNVKVRDVPEISTTQFGVEAGSGIVNTLKFDTTTDKTSTHYDSLKAQGYVLVKKPEWGVILNEFNVFNVLDYAADLVEDLPAFEEIEVKAWNKYGYSDDTTIKLLFSDDCLIHNEDLDTSTNLTSSGSYSKNFYIKGYRVEQEWVSKYSELAKSWYGRLAKEVIYYPDDLLSSLAGEVSAQGTFYTVEPTTCDRSLVKTFKGSSRFHLPFANTDEIHLSKSLTVNISLPNLFGNARRNLYLDAKYNNHYLKTPFSITVNGNESSSSRNYTSYMDLNFDLKMNSSGVYSAKMSGQQIYIFSNQSFIGDMKAEFTSEVYQTNDGWQSVITGEVIVMPVNSSEFGSNKFIDKVNFEARQNDDGTWYSGPFGEALIGGFYLMNIHDVREREEKTLLHGSANYELVKQIDGTWISLVNGPFTVPNLGGDGYLIYQNYELKQGSENNWWKSILSGTSYRYGRIPLGSDKNKKSYADHPVILMESVSHEIVPYESGSQRDYLSEITDWTYATGFETYVFNYEDEYTRTEYEFVWENGTKQNHSVITEERKDIYQLPNNEKLYTKSIKNYVAKPYYGGFEPVLSQTTIRTYNKDTDSWFMKVTDYEILQSDGGRWYSKKIED